MKKKSTTNGLTPIETTLVGFGGRPQQTTREDPCSWTSSGPLVLLRDLAGGPTASRSLIGSFRPGVRHPRRQDVVGGAEGLQQVPLRNHPGEHRGIRGGDPTGGQPPQGRAQQRDVTPVPAVHGSDQLQRKVPQQAREPGGHGHRNTPPNPYTSPMT